MARLTFGSVPLGRRNLFEDRRRAALSCVGVGAGLLLALLMAGVFGGLNRQESAYMDRNPADVVVSQEGVRTMQLSISALPPETTAAVAAVPGVAWAEPLRQMTSTVAVGDTKLVAYVFGVDGSGGGDATGGGDAAGTGAAGRGGPGEVVEGAPAGPGEVVLDAGGAAQLGIGVGDQVEVFGVERRVAGLSEGLTSVACTSVFLPAEDFAAGAGPGLNYVLVGSDGSRSPDALAADVAAAVPDATVQTAETFSAEEAALVRDMYAELFSTMRVLGFVIALALVSLTLSSITTAKRREYGIVAALGATPGRLAAVVASQAAWAVLAATVVAVVAALGLGAAIDRALPNIELVLGPRDVLVTLLGAVLVGIPAALVPLRSVLAVDPATAFRSR